MASIDDNTYIFSQLQLELLDVLLLIFNLSVTILVHFDQMILNLSQVVQFIDQCLVLFSTFLDVVLSSRLVLDGVELDRCH